MNRLFNRLRASMTVRIKNYRASTRAWWHTRIDPRPFTFTDRHGIKLKMLAQDDLRSLFFHCAHFDDSGVLAAVAPLLRPGSTVVDVGANFGQFALFAAARVGAAGRVHAFEPAPAVWERFQENLACNTDCRDRVVDHRLALSDRPGRANFYHYPENPAWNSLHPHEKWISLEDRARNAPTITPKVVVQTDVTTLDLFCTKADVASIDLLKIDVEGFELSVLRGAHELLRRRQIGAVVFEICPDLTAAVGYSPHTITRYLADVGYNCSRVEAHGHLTPVHADFDFPFLANYIAVPDA